MVFNSSVTHTGPSSSISYMALLKNSIIHNLKSKVMFYCLPSFVSFTLNILRENRIYMLIVLKT